MAQRQELLIKTMLDGWNTQLARTNTLLDKLTDGQLQEDIAPGRNSGVYLLGHLAAVHDRMLPLLGFGEQMYPQYDEVFLTSPDKSGKQMPAAQELRQSWKNVNEKLSTHYNALAPDDWFQKHSSVSEEDFAKEPHRNKLSVLMSRTNHLAYHFGQLALLKK